MAFRRTNNKKNLNLIKFNTSLARDSITIKNASTIDVNEDDHVDSGMIYLSVNEYNKYGSSRRSFSPGTPKYYQNIQETFTIGLVNHNNGN